MSIYDIHAVLLLGLFKVDLSMSIEKLAANVLQATVRLKFTNHQKQRSVSMMDFLFQMFRVSDTLFALLITNRFSWAFHMGLPKTLTGGLEKRI